jgi:glucokinase
MTIDRSLRPANAAYQSPTALALVGDIGGTNARLALMEISAGQKPHALQERTFLCADFPSLEDVIQEFLAGLGKSDRPATVVAAAAGPIVDGAVVFTNLNWQVTETNLAALGFSHARLINDFVALALAVPSLTDRDLCALGGPTLGTTDGVIAVMGAGTGFGATGLVTDHMRPIPVATESGHMSFAPFDPVEIEILRVLSERFTHVSIEKILSGPGLINLYGALSLIMGVPVDPAMDSAAAIVAAADAGGRVAIEAVERFCLIFGAVAGNLALAFGARGGVFLAGGIAPKLIRRLSQPGFRQRFEMKGPMTDYLRNIPTKVVMRDDAALFGAARVAAEFHKFQWLAAK